MSLFLYNCHVGIRPKQPQMGGLQVPLDPVSKLPGLLDALKLMDAAVQQNNYHEKLLMYRNVRIPQHDKVNGQRHLCSHMCCHHACEKQN